MILKPRPYQEECLQKFDEFYGKGLTRLATVLPTGMGKTVIMAEMAHRFILETGKKVAIFVQRNELINQTRDKLHTINPELTVGVVKRTRHEIDNQVVIISIQTIGRRDHKRLHSIPADHFGLAIVDECHHAAARSYVEALQYFGAYSEESGLRTAGFTATLQRQDKLGLGDVFQEVVYKRDILFGIRNGYLVDIRAKAVQIDDLLDGVVVRGGDYTEGSLGDALISSDAGRLIAHAYREHASDRTGIVFAPTVASAVQIVNDLHDAGFTAEVVTGATTIEDRALIFKRVRIGETQILVNCMVLTEGFDMPQVSCVVIARPTTNQGLFVQMVGRGARPWVLHDPQSSYPWIAKPKMDLLVLDVVGAAGKNRLASIADLSETRIGEIKDGESISDAVDREEEESDDPCIAGPDVTKVKVTDVDLFKASPFSFRRTTGRGYIYIPTKDWMIAIYPETSAPDTLYMVGRIWCGKGPKMKGSTYVRNADLGYAMAIAESVADELDSGTISKKGASWRKKKEPATDAQLAKLRSLRVKFSPSTITKTEASDLIDETVSSPALDWYVPPAPVETEY